MKRKNNLAFTLIELLVVTSIMGLMASAAMASFQQGAKQARDARRLSDMDNIRKALHLYLLDYGRYPQDIDTSGECNGGWDSSGDGDFIPELTAAKYFAHDVRDPSINNNNIDTSTGLPCGNYQYAHYVAGQWGCDPSRGRYYVLKVVDMESTPSFPGAGGPPWPTSPGWRCGATNIWNTWSEYVIGEYTN
jgi:prepilin-type N-terminal cleavage/methylation domain-containing protein